MRHVYGPQQAQQAQPATSSISPLTDRDTSVHYTHESLLLSNDVQAARIAALSAVDREIDASRQLLRSLRNALTPVSLLPSEVLARVFYFLSLEEPPSSGQQNLGWIRATHVCRLWRQVALGDSSLWARISGMPTKRELVSEMLARTRNAPLDIDIKIDRATTPEVLLLFPPHLSHTRKFRLHIVATLHSDSFRDIYCQEAPALEYFELNSLTSPISFRELGGTTLFKRQALKLRTLILSHIIIPWSLIPYGQLTRLVIFLRNGVSIADVTSLGNLNQLADLLVNSPELEVLSLESCLPSQFIHFPYSREIHLPRLSSLSLCESSFRIANLLKSLKLPSTTTLHFYCRPENTSTYDEHLLLPFVSEHFQSPPLIEFKSLTVDLCYVDWLDVAASTSLSTPRPRHPQNTADDDFILYIEGLPEHASGHCIDLFERLCEVLPISNIEFLSIAAPGTVGSVKWVELFKRCTKLTMLHVIGRGTSSLVRALASPKVTNTRRSGKAKKVGRNDGDSTPAGSTTPHASIFPNLTFLSLKRLDSAEKEHSTGILFDVVQRGLRQRMVEYGAPLKMLRIDNCAISSKRAEALQKLVKKFYWDRGERIPNNGRIGQYDEWWEIFFDHEK